MRIFGHELEFVCVDDQNRFDAPYLVAGDVALDIPNNTESVLCIFPNSIDRHSRYRHEVVLTTSLPLRPHVQCDQKNASTTPQLASYRYPSEQTIMGHESVMFWYIKESRQSMYEFQNAGKTHNEYLLTGSQLQNFHIRLVSRNYVWDADKLSYDIIDTPYSLPDNSLWWLGLVITPLA